MTSAALLPRRSRGPTLAAIAATAACVFLVVMTFLAVQLRAGSDPALGTVASTSPVAHVAKPSAGHRGRHAAPVLVTRSSGR
jgi:hypothetical protein